MAKVAQEKPEQTVLYGTPVVDGIAYAPVVWTRRPPIPDLTAPDLPEERRGEEAKKFTQAADEVTAKLQERADSTTGHAAALLSVTASIASDPAWRKEVTRMIRRGTPAVQATMHATDRFVTKFEKAGGILAERTTDLRDVRDRVIAKLLGREEPGIPTPSERVVLFADELTPADTADLDPTLFVAIVTQLGGPTSHTSIIARQLGLPCIVAARDISDIDEGTYVLVDGQRGTIRTDATPEEAQRRVDADRERVELIQKWSGPAQLADGTPVELLTNVRDGDTARDGRSVGAQGVGLLRTELCFLGASAEPTVEQQRALYQPAFEAFPHSKIVFRTLDAGSDKPVPYATLTDEANPALGVRGLRTSGHNPGLLLHQLDAIAQCAHAANHEDTWVMAPMISTIPEAEWFTKLVHERGLKAGIMVEVPSVAVLIDQFMEIVDFVSVGTNDLTQYVMAADRLSADLAEYSDPWQPAALALISNVARAGIRSGTPVGVCGEAAADPLLSCVLVGMGVTSLSVAPPALKAVGAQLSQFTLEQCQEAARAVRAARDQGDARHRARRVFEI
ncbi:phosphoenolpyruvate--protein phosphotransferase [Gleimia hominis]|uniref:phosphoenolpyruvate--protein phosphotransferase n=1 Tax=Gleimia hominis TaxID=595468 RepID=UPI001E4A0F5A|nr:putative PEP-binding protein [Gleimia hominis]WIK64440.1 PEP-utilizing enzyme [Gleimia hominis]